MKKLTAILCTALMVAAACVTTFAAENPSPGNPVRPPRPPRPPYIQPVNPSAPDSQETPSTSSGTSTTTAATTPAKQTAVTGTPVTVDTDPSVTTVNPNGRAIVLVEADPKDYAENSIERKVIDVFSDGQAHEVSEIFSIIGVTTDTLQSKPSNKIVVLNNLEPISRPLALKYSDTGELVEAGKVKLSFAGNELTKGLTDGQLCVLSMETRTNPAENALGDAAVDAQNTVTAFFQNTGLQLLMKNNG